MTHNAVFVSRDRVLMVANGTLPGPDQVRLALGAADAVRRLRAAGYRLVTVSNEPGVARGLFDEEALELVNARLKQLLTEEKAAIDGLYYCPYLAGADAVVSQYRRDSDLQLPRPGMFHQAAGDHSLDLSASWLVGTSPEDIAAGRAAGCRTVLLGDPEAPVVDPTNQADYVFSSLSEAADLILSSPPAIAPAPAPAPEHSAAVAPVAPAGDDSSDAVADRLDAILDFLQQQRRAAMHRDFSTSKLLGAVCQMVALGLLLWSWMAMIDGDYNQAVTRLLSMIAVQLIALTLFVLHQRD